MARTSGIVSISPAEPASAIGTKEWVQVIAAAPATIVAWPARYRRRARRRGAEREVMAGPGRWTAGGTAGPHAASLRAAGVGERPIRRPFAPGFRARAGATAGAAFAVDGG